MEIKTYKKALEYLNGFISPIIFKRIEDNAGFDPLDRMRTLLGLIGNPERKFKSVLVTGTSGKGSTSYLISHILKTAGYKVGLTISPHLQKVNERFQINGKGISDKKFTEMVGSLVQTIGLMKKMPVGKPSYFEILIGIAFKYFAEQKIDIAVVEVGIEGKYDATNVLDPLMVVLTNISLDHTQILGDTVEKIAKEAAGAIKGLRIKDKGLINHSSLIINHLTVISGVRQSSVIKIIEDRSKDMGAELRLLWGDFGYKIKQESASGIDFDFLSHEKTLDDLKLSLLGQYQAENASLAIKAILELKKFGFKISDKAIRKALSSAFFPGRFEIIRVNSRSKFIVHGIYHQPSTINHLLVLDGAHNPTKMKEFLRNLKKIFPKERKVFIIGFKFDKDIRTMLREITRVADEIIVTEFSRETDVALHASADAESIKYQVLCSKYKGKVVVEEDSKKALDKAFNILISQYPNIPSIIVVTGSLYLVGEIRSLIYRL